MDMGNPSFDPDERTVFLQRDSASVSRRSWTPLLSASLRSMAKARCPLVPWLAQEPALRRPRASTSGNLPQVRWHRIPSDLFSDS